MKNLSSEMQHRLTQSVVLTLLLTFHAYAAAIVEPDVRKLSIGLY